MKKIIRISTVPISLNIFCKGLLYDLSSQYEIIAVSSTLDTNKLSSIDGVSYVIKDFTEISIDNLYSKTSLKQNSKIMTILLKP